MLNNSRAPDRQCDLPELLVHGADDPTRVELLIGLDGVSSHPAPRLVLRLS
jgi:hypothetical protein